MNNHQTSFTFGDTVYLVTDREQLPRIVIGISLRPNSSPFYELGSGAESSFHFEIEFSRSIDESLKLGLKK